MHRALMCGLWGGKGWRRDSVAERRGGVTTGRSHCPVILGHIFLARINLLNIRAFPLAFTCCFESEDVLAHVNVSLPFCFCAPLPVVV